MIKSEIQIKLKIFYHLGFFVSVSVRNNGFSLAATCNATRRMWLFSLPRWQSHGHEVYRNNFFFASKTRHSGDVTFRDQEITSFPPAHARL